MIHIFSKMELWICYFKNYFWRDIFFAILQQLYHEVIFFQCGMSRYELNNINKLLFVSNIVLKRVLPVKTIYPTVPGSVPLLGLLLPGPARPFEYLNAEYGYFENYFPQKNHLNTTKQTKQDRVQPQLQEPLLRPQEGGGRSRDCNKNSYIREICVKHVCVRIH